MPVISVVYFSAAIRGDRVMAGTIKELAQFVKSLPVIFLNPRIGDDDPVSHDMLAHEIEKRDIDEVNRCTHLIAEISGASSGVGREIERAHMKHYLGYRRAEVLSLCKRQYEHSASPMLMGMDKDRYPNVTVALYADVSEAKAHIKKFLGV